MKIVLMSDLHFEFHKDCGIGFIEEILDNTPECDIVVLAGDVAPLRHYSDVILEFLKKLSNKAYQVIYVPGNHDFYNDSIENGLKRLDKLKKEFWGTGVIVVENSYDIINYYQYKILAGTLWFSNLYPDPSLKGCLNDFHQIPDLEQYIYKYNSDFKKALLEVNSDNLICVTHHAPSYQIVHPKYYGSAINQFFCNDLDKEISIIKPKLWLFGHVHDKVDMMLYNTRLLANPSGYWHEMDINWKPKVIEI